MCERTVVPVFAPLFVLLATSPALAHGGEDLIEATAWTTWELTPDIVIPTLLVAACYIAGLLRRANAAQPVRSEEHTSELQSLMRISYAVFCLKKKNIE